MPRSRWSLLPVLLSAACAERRDPERIVASGHVEATEVRVSTKIGGTLATLAIAEGDRVQAGQSLAQIDTKDLDLALGAARAEKQVAQAELNLRLAGPRRQDVQELELKIAAVDVELRNAERDLERMEALLARGSGTTKARDDARARRDALVAQRGSMKEALSRLRAGNRIEEIDAARARVAAAEARIAQLRQQVADAAIESPLAGVVSEKLVEQGELLSPGATLCVITDLGDAWLTVYVGEPDLARIRIGQEAEVLTDDGQKRRGRITYVSQQAEFTPKNVQTREERVKLVYKVKVGLDNQDGLFKPGMPAQAHLRAAGACLRPER